MACITHSCRLCGYDEFNNDPRHPRICPECGGDISHFWDEEFDDHEDEPGEDLEPRGEEIEEEGSDEPAED